MKRLSIATKNGAPLKTLSIATTPTVRHEPTVAREPGKIDAEIRKFIRQAATVGIKWPLILCGKPGVGKTCAGLCVVDHVPGAEWWPWGEFWRFALDVAMGRRIHDVIPGRRTEDGWFEPSRRVKWTTPGMWKWFADLPLAVFDDVGVSEANPTQRETLTTALDRREGKPLIITSNLNQADLGAAFDARVLDRISAGTVVAKFGREAKSMR